MRAWAVLCLLFAGHGLSLLRAQEVAASAPAPEQEFFRRETEWFEVNSAEPETGALLAQAALDTEVALRGLIAAPEGFPSRIIVRDAGPVLALEAELDRAATGLVTLRLRRGLASEVRGLWLVRSVLVRAGGRAGRIEGPVAPSWIEIGLSEAARIRSEPGRGILHARGVLAAPLPPLASVLTGGSAPPDPALSWFAVRALAQLPEGRVRLFRFAGAEAGADPRLLFLESFGSLPQLASGVQAWWLVQAAGQAREWAGPGYLRDWPDRVRALLVVEVERGEESAILGADDLWRLRRRGWVRELANVRMREARLLLTEAPAPWYDAVLSAGQTWEALRRGREAAFRAGWDRAASDVLRGQQLDAELRARLEAWESRLGSR